MTYEELFFHTSKLVMELEGEAGKLLVHLIATAITTGTNEIHGTTRGLAKELRCWRNNIIAAVEELKPYIDVSVSQKTGYTFRLPADWFAEGRGIFTDWDAVEKSGTWSELRTTTGPEDEPPPDRNSGHDRRTNGEDRTTGGSNGEPQRRTNGEDRTTGGSKNEPTSTQNQQVTEQNFASNRIDRVLVNIEGFRSIEQIACAKVVPPEMHADGVELSNAIRAYHRQYGPRNAPDRPVDEQIIARCLAVAPLGSLLSELKQMRMRAVRAGSGHGWYVSVFCQRLKGIPSKVLAACLEDLRKQTRSRPQANLDFSTQLTADVRQGMRRIS